MINGSAARNLPSCNGDKDVTNENGTNVVANKDGAKRRASSSAGNGQDETIKGKKDSGVDMSRDRKGKPAGNEVSQYPLYKPSNLAIDAPAAYISDMPFKGVRSTLINALNVWLHVPAPAVKTITSVVTKLHNASLILDDLEDNSPLRRGLPSAHIIFGQAQSINSANFMFVRAVQEVAQGLGPRALTAVLEELENLYLGQSWDLYWKFNLTCPTEAEYVNMIDHKTGGMFRMLLRVMRAETTAAIPAGVDFERLTLLFGRFFQIRDDYMNFGDYAAQKGLCEDLDEGKFSYPIIYCLANSPEYRGHILGIFRQRPTAATVTPSPLSRETKAHLVACLAKSGAFDKTLGCLRDVEHELVLEIDRLERLTGEPNPMLRFCLAKLSVKGIAPLG
ncbi:geranylgeranyl pyrophosphate synthase [Colletotrichum sojae]|uniref:Geranylgeranyl pyrophosphate synthase n=1 Tax=Colletotrichum sojae TaxID=2175907 RepID=A0A8H6MNG7_9PEZI|nr:geranylgeranyl pyrophosphate synthase [Colletotrichum sojae]